MARTTRSGPKPASLSGATLKRKGALPGSGAGAIGLKPPASPHGIVTAVSMMKDEGPFVLEWIAHHLAVGFNRIVVYTNDCSDGTDKILMRLEELGLAHHRINVIPEGQRPQPSALNHAQDEPLVAESDWLMVFDADEFLCIRHGDGTLGELLTAIKAKGANGIVVTWRIFGSGGVHHWSRDMVTEQYLMAAPVSWNKGWGVKTLFTYDAEYWKLGIHRPKLKSKWLDTGFPDTVRWLNGSGRAMEDYFRFRGWRSITRTVGYDWVQMNHYAVKSIDSYAIRKFRGNVNFKKDKYNADYWALQDRNEVRDDAMLRYAAERRRIFDALLADPVLGPLHHAAIDRVEARLAEFKATPDYADLVAGLKAASAIPIDQVEAKPPQPRDKEKIAALMSEVERRTANRQRDERRKPPQDRPAGLVSLYLRAPSEGPMPPDLAWHANQGIDLPADPGLFTPPALALIAAGKFERNLARALNRLLPQGAIHAEIGAGCGFIAARLARSRPDLSLFIHEDDPIMRRALLLIWDRNGVRPGSNLRLSSEPRATHAGALAQLLRESRATSLSFGDPGLAPAVLRGNLMDAGLTPDVVVLTNRLLAHRTADIAEFESVLAEAGLTERAPLDATLALAFTRPGMIAKAGRQSG